MNNNYENYYRNNDYRINRRRNRTSDDSTSEDDRCNSDNCRYNNYDDNYRRARNYNDDYRREDRRRNEREECRNNSDEERRHVHEFIGSTKFAEQGRERNNHRFAGVTCEAIRCGNSHVHKLRANTDSRDHHHEICDTTGPAIYVGGGKHVHLVKGRTTREDGHVHEYIFATLIEDPTE